MLRKEVKYVVLVLAFIIVQTAMVTIVPFGYSQQTVTPLSITQKGIDKLNELISSKELEPGWAKSFSQVTVSIRNVKGFAEYVLQFSSASGSPAVVTLFFNVKGEYSGSSLGN